MKMIDILFFLGFIFNLAIFDRLREFTNFQSWWENSWLSRIKSEFWYKWWRSKDEDELRYLRIKFTLGSFVEFPNKPCRFEFSFKIPLHPIFWDGYHCFKNMHILWISVYSGWKFGIGWIMLSWIIWWLGQQITYKLMQRKIWKKFH